MKLKQTPRDFHVVEITSVVPSDGPFALYRLTKRGLTTTSALAHVQHRWKVARQRVSFGGLKDRHAETVQHFTIFRGPQRGLNHNALTVEYLGQVPEPFTSDAIAANRFRVRLCEVEAGAQARAEQIAANGWPNYFDDQRFGSTASGGELVARLMVLGQYEQALRLALTQPYDFDRAAQKAEKAKLDRNWGQWSQCVRVLSPGVGRALASHLEQRPGDFRGAVRLLQPELQGMHLAAYQSFIWNRMLATLLKQELPSWQMLPLRLGEFPTALTVPDTLRCHLLSTRLPLPSARLAESSAKPWAKLIAEALQDQGLVISQMKLPGLRKPFFSRGERSAWVMPASFSAVAEPESRTLELRFDLPRGCYATLFAKHLQLGLA